MFTYLKILVISILTLLQTESFFNPCKVGKLFSENLQNRWYVQTSQLMIHKKQKQNMIIWSTIVCHSTIAWK